MRSAWIVVVLMLWCAVASAQPAPDEQPPPPPVDTSQQDYDAAFGAMVRGDFDNAAAGFDAVVASSQNSDLSAAAREMARLARELSAKHVTFAAPSGPGGGVTAIAPEEDRYEGRASFIVWTTFFGIYSGIVLIDDTNVSDYRAGILIDVGTTAAALTGSLLYTKHHRMTGPMADAYSLGMLEGIGNAGLLVAPLGITDTSGEVQTTLWFAGAAGGAAGLLYGANTRITRGQISFAGTLSILGIASTGLGLVIANPDLSTHTILDVMAGGLDAGLGAGLYFGRNLDWSVSRARLVQLGAILGGLGGFAAAALTFGDSSNNTNTDARIAASMVLAGTWGGFALGDYFTRNMRPDKRYRVAAGANVTLAPMTLPGGGGLTLAGSW